MICGICSLKSNKDVRLAINIISKMLINKTLLKYSNNVIREMAQRQKN